MRVCVASLYSAVSFTNKITRKVIDEVNIQKKNVLTVSCNIHLDLKEISIGFTAYQSDGYYVK